MLIVEGPDGGGKTTLVEELTLLTRWPVAERVVSKQANAMTDLRVWTTANLREGFQRTIFDRHRLISDPVYRFALPHKQPDPELYEQEWLTSAMDLFAYIDPIIVFCMPPIEVVRANLEGDKDNDVVRDHMDKIYYAYNVQWAHLRSWGKWRFTSVIWYDYTNKEQASRALNELSKVVARRSEFETIRSQR